jgi:hypothetical protein
MPDRRSARLAVAFACTAGLLTAAAAPAGAATLTATPGKLQAVLRTAHPGDVVQLRGGTYRDQVAVPAFSGDVALRPYLNEVPVLLSAAFTGGSHLRLERLRLNNTVVSGVADMTVADSEVTVNGATFKDTRGLTVSGTKVHDAYDGLVVRNSTGFTISGNECWNVPTPNRVQSGDCIQLGRTSNWSIVGNSFHDQPNKPHADAIEIVNTNSDGLIAANRFRNVRGVIFTPGDNTPTSTQTRMTIVDNLFAQTREFAFNGVRMHDSRLLYNTAGDGGFVQFGGASSGNVVVGNIMRDYRVDPARASQYVSLEDYNLVGTYRAGLRKGPHDIPGAATFDNAAAGDYHLAPGSKGVGAGSLAWMPAADLLGAPRTIPDMGAFAVPR